MRIEKGDKVVLDTKNENLNDKQVDQIGFRGYVEKDYGLYYDVKLVNGVVLKCHHNKLILIEKVIG